VQITFPAVSIEASLRDLNAGTAHEPVSEDNHLSENITHVLVGDKILGTACAH
jgi:hypothetical protein